MTAPMTPPNPSTSTQSERMVTVTTAQAAIEAGVKAATVRTWVSRGLLMVAVRDEHGWPLYDLAAVLRVERNNRQRI